MKGTTATRRQLQVLRLVAKGIEEGVQPTMRELGDALRIASTNGVSDHLRALERKGLLERTRKGSPRALRITRAGQRQLGSAA